MKTTRETFVEIWHLLSMREKLIFARWHYGIMFWSAAADFAIRRMRKSRNAFSRRMKEART